MQSVSGNSERPLVSDLFEFDEVEVDLSSVLTAFSRKNKPLSQAWAISKIKPFSEHPQVIDKSFSAVLAKKPDSIRASISEAEPRIREILAHVFLACADRRK